MTSTEKKVFLYKQVYQDLKNKISAQTYLPGDMLPSEREIGELYHVDRTTVRKAFSLLVDEGLVEKRPGKGTVVVQRPLKSPGQSSPAPAEAPKTLIFLLPRSAYKEDRITVPFYYELFDHIGQACRPFGYLLVYTSLEQTEDFDHLLASAQSIAGIIFVSNTPEICIEKAIQAGIPSVLVNSYNALLPSILSDNYAGTYAAANYLIGAGHRKIAVLNGDPGYFTAKERLNGVISAMKEHHLQLLDEYYCCAGSWEADGGYVAIDAMLKSGFEPPTAVIAFNDRLATGAMQAISQNGLSIPGDISVFGYDNSDHAKYSIPKMCSVEIHTSLMAKAALQSLLSSITCHELLPIKIVVPTELVLRESVRTRAPK
ncbi:MAG: substrate-binding domain-containing protein [Lachnospiraceae bacterium]|nr:substrate-binding domain-containing protein [Lachnospiraceae bacterium]